MESNTVKAKMPFRKLNRERKVKKGKLNLCEFARILGKVG